MQVRPARPEDAGEVSRLAMRAKATWSYPAAWLDAWREELTLTEAYLRENPAWCAEKDGRLVGFCALEADGEGLEIGHLWVDPECQGAGIGRALMREAMKTAGRLRPAVAVRVVADPNAVSFYQALGARLTGFLPAPMPGAPSRELPVLELAGER
jgi:ribosomal protein S18 acetylase RimI-like enzyme